MLGANRDYAKNTSGTGHYFGFDLGYDKPATVSLGTYAALYTGNIAGTVWKSKGDGEKRKYDYSYDNVNRLTAAGFAQWVSGTGSSATFNTTVSGMDFSVSNLTYDYNGNIMSMSQKGWKLTNSDFIDQLTYTYLPNSNKLQNVIDASQDKNTKLGDFRYSSLYENTVTATKASSVTDYTYDGNGNLQKDLNKDIGTSSTNGITYNYLNLPSTITVTNKGTISYVYDALGNKLQKQTTEGTKLTSTLYMFGNYVNDTLQYLPMEEGRIRTSSIAGNPQFVYDYFKTDTARSINIRSASYYYSKLSDVKIDLLGNFP